MLLKVKWLIILIVAQLKVSFTATVELKLGKIIGTREETIFNKRLYYAFYGVPYAQPPVGKLRFKDPRPPKKWKRTLDATTDYNGACAQAHIIHKYGLQGYEDCLYMNIYTPMLPQHSDFKLKPVLVYIHGYAFASNFGHLYRADSLIEKDIVFVSVSHRIGVFGFLKIDDSKLDANMGLKDIVMALKWIRKYIKHFGGDANKITVMGSDSGATFLSLLLMTEHRKLFSRIILQSGAAFSPSIFQSDYKVERQRLNANLKKMGYKDILSASTKDIINASQAIYNSKEMVNFQKPIVPFTPILEEKSNISLLVQSPDEFYKNFIKQNISKPMLIGYNNRESIPELIPFIHNPHFLKYFSNYFKFMIPFSDGCTFNYTTSTYKEVADKIKGYYFNHNISENSLDSFLKYTTDLKIYPIWKFIQTMLSLKKHKMFVYKFNYVGAFNAVKATSLNEAKVKIKGASNGDELCYIFRCGPLSENYFRIANDTDNRDLKFIKDITDLWANFVKTGNPTQIAQSSDIIWQPVTANQTTLLHLGKETTLINPNTETKMYQFWNEIYKDLYSNNHCIKTIHEEL